MGQALPSDRPGLAPRLGARRSVLRIRSWRPQDDLHHQRGRSFAPQLTQDHQDRGSFPNDDAALKLLYLAVKNAGLRWRRGVEWTTAMGQFAIQFGERFPGTAR